MDDSDKVENGMTVGEVKEYIGIINRKMRDIGSVISFAVDDSNSGCQLHVYHCGKLLSRGRLTYLLDSWTVGLGSGRYIETKKYFLSQDTMVDIGIAKENEAEEDKERFGNYQYWGVQNG